MGDELEGDAPTMSFSVMPYLVLVIVTAFHALGKPYV
jgi:hypothetical protein